MMTVYLYAFIILCILGGVGVSIYFFTNSIIDLKERENDSVLRICPPDCQGDECKNCLKYDEVVLEEEEMMGEDEYIRRLNERIEKINKKLI